MSAYKSGSIGQKDRTDPTSTFKDRSIEHIPCQHTKSCILACLMSINKIKHQNIHYNGHNSCRWLLTFAFIIYHLPLHFTVNENVGIEFRSRTDGGFYKPQRLRTHADDCALCASTDGDMQRMVDLFAKACVNWSDNQHQEDGSHVQTWPRGTIC